MPYLDIPVNITNDLEQEMANVFLMYDFDGSKMIESTKIPTILRFLGCVPTEIEINEFIKSCEFEDIPGYIHLSKFILNLNNCLLEEIMRPATIDELENAFKILDPRQKGYINAEDFMSKIKLHGELIKNDELLKLKSVALTNEKCIYEPYICKLLHEPVNSIYKRVKEIAMESEKLSES